MVETVLKVEVNKKKGEERKEKRDDKIHISPPPSTPEYLAREEVPASAREGCIYIFLLKVQQHPPSVRRRISLETETDPAHS